MARAIVPAVASEQVMARLNLVLFGGFRATIGARPILLPLKKAQGMLAFLALSPAQRQTRERLAALFWADASEEQARNSLRQTLFTVRSALGRAGAEVVGGDAEIGRASCRERVKVRGDAVTP